MSKSQLLASTALQSTTAVIYCRVSSAAQMQKGHGLASQETRCREFARMKGYEVAQVFTDEAVSGGLINRPGMQAMLSFLRTNRKRGNYVVLIDDISRLARDIRAHLDLRSAISADLLPRMILVFWLACFPTKETGNETIQVFR